MEAGALGVKAILCQVYKRTSYKIKQWKAGRKEMAIAAMT